MSTQQRNGSSRSHQRRHPFQRSRRITDPFFKIIFFAIFFWWVNGIFPISRELFRFGTVATAMKSNTTHIVKPYFPKCNNTSDLEILKENQHATISVLLLLLGAFSTIASITMVPCSPKLFIRTIKIVWISISITSVYYIYHITTNPELQTCSECICDSYRMVYITICFTVLFVIVLTVFFIMKVDGTYINIASLRIRSVGGIFRLRYLILFASFIVAIMMFVAVMTTKSIIPSDETNRLHQIIFFLSGLYLIRFLYGYARAVSCLVCIVWSEKEDETVFTLRSILKCIYKITRYHLGTIAFEATLILPPFAALYSFGCGKSIESGKATGNFKNFCTRIITTHCVMFNISSYSVIETCRHGDNFLKACRRIAILSSENEKKLIITTQLHYFMLVSMSIVFSSIFMIKAFVIEILLHAGIDFNTPALQLTFVVAFLFSSTFFTIYTNILIDYIIQMQFITDQRSHIGSSNSQREIISLIPSVEQSNLRSSHFL